MSTNINLSMGWDILKDLYKSVSGDSDVSNEDVRKMLKDADLNKDGKITEDEFRKACEASDDFQEMEKKYLEAYKLIAKLDNDCSSISTADIESALKEIDALENQTGAGATGGTDGAGNTTGPTNTTGNGSGDDTTTTPDEQPATEIKSTIPAAVVDGKDVPTLRADRSDTLADLREMKTEKGKIKSSEAYMAAKREYNVADGEYTKSLNALVDIYKQKEEAGVALTEQEQAVVDLKDTRDTLKSREEEQQGAVDQINASISQANTALDGLNSSLDSLQPPSESLKVPIYDEQTGEQTGVDTSAYDAAMAAYEAEKANLESQIAAKENEIVSLEETLVKQELALTQLQEDIIENETKMNEALQAVQTAAEAAENVDQAELDQIKATTDAQIASMAAWENMAKVEEELGAQIDADIEQLRANMSAYDDALDKANEEQEKNLPEGYTYQDGFVRDQDGRLLVGRNADQELPKGYQAQDDGTIIDTNTGEVVGRVITSKVDATGDGILDEVSQVYLYSDALQNRNPYKLLGADSATGDSFETYLATKGLNVDTTDRKYIDQALEEYKQLNAQRAEFNRLYTQFSNDPELKEYLDDTFYTVHHGGVLINSSYSKYSLDGVRSMVEQFGMFASEGEDKRYGGIKEDDFGTCVPKAIEEMKEILEKTGKATVEEE